MRAVDRRTVLRFGLLMSATLVASGHTPYRQWIIYRRKHLLIGCHKEDPATYDLAKRAVGLLGEHLPEAKSRPARAPSAARLASLMRTEQMDVAIVSAQDARAMVAGSGAFAAFGATDLRVLLPVGERLMVARADFPPRFAWLVSGALSGTELADAPDPSADYGVPWHPGSMASLQGRPEPGDEGNE